MNRKKIKKGNFLIFVLLAIIFVSLQFSNFKIFEVKPDFFLIFVALIPIFITEILEGVFLLALASFLAKFTPQVSGEILAVFLAGLVIIVLKKFIPFHSFLSFLAATLFLTIVSYLILYPAFIFSAIFIKEILYNIIIGSVAFFALSRLKA